MKIWIFNYDCRHEGKFILKYLYPFLEFFMKNYYLWSLTQFNINFSKLITNFRHEGKTFLNRLYYQYLYPLLGICYGKLEFLITHTIWYEFLNIDFSIINYDFSSRRKNYFKMRFLSIFVPILTNFWW